VHAESLLCGLLNRSTSSLSGKGQFAADGEKIKGRGAFIHPFIFTTADAKSRPPRKGDVGRYSAGLSMHNPERQFGLYRIHVPAIRVACIYRHGESGAS
jgi:hypothetical protein